MFLLLEVLRKISLKGTVKLSEVKWGQGPFEEEEERKKKASKSSKSWSPLIKTKVLISVILMVIFNFIEQL